MAEKIRDWCKPEVDGGRGGSTGPVRVELLNEWITTLRGPGSGAVRSLEARWQSPRPVIRPASGPQ